MNVTRSTPVYYLSMIYNTSISCLILEWSKSKWQTWWRRLKKPPTSSFVYLAGKGVAMFLNDSFLNWTLCCLNSHSEHLGPYRVINRYSSDISVLSENNVYSRRNRRGVPIHSRAGNRRLIAISHEVIFWV